MHRLAHVISSLRVLLPNHKAVGEEINNVQEILTKVLLILGIHFYKTRYPNIKSSFFFLFASLTLE